MKYLVLLLLFNFSFAQKDVYPIEEKHQHLINNPNYSNEIFKDINNVLDNFLGNWTYSDMNNEVLIEMKQHDVFVFPSLFDGFGLVILEALSRGLPVITTKNTGGPDILEDGSDGFIVPIRSSEAITEKLQLLCDDRTLLEKMSAAALKKAARYSWQEYRHNLKTTTKIAAAQDSFTS